MTNVQSSPNSKNPKYWLSLIANAVPESKIKTRELWKEAQEFNLIFAAIIRNTNANNSK